MEMNDETQEFSYWPSVGLASVLMGIVMFAISTITGYVQINSEPTGAIFQPAYFGYIFLCLIGAFTGMLAVWHFARESGQPFTLGKGALIGFLAGVGVVIISSVLGQLWNLIDPNFKDQMMKSMIANVDAMSNIPEDARKTQIDAIAQQFRESGSITGILKQMAYGIPFYGVLNLLTGLIGVKLFAKEKEV